MINAFVTGDKELSLKLKNIPVKVKMGLVAEIGRITIKLQEIVAEQKLKGQVLNRVTGRLATNIDQVVHENSFGVVGIVWTKVPYARRHEYGFNGDETVKAHLRQIKQAWGKSIAPKSVQVSAHSRKINYPAKSFMRSALREMAPEIKTRLEKAIAESIH